MGKNPSYAVAKNIHFGGLRNENLQNIKKIKPEGMLRKEEPSGLILGIGAERRKGNPCSDTDRKYMKARILS